MSEVTPVRDPTLMLGGGEMGERIRRFDWAKSPLGLPAQWPGSLRTLIQVMLSSTQPMFIAWGPERTMLYNDAYTPMLAQRHPEALGSGSPKSGQISSSILVPS